MFQLISVSLIHLIAHAYNFFLFLCNMRGKRNKNIKEEPLSVQHNISAPQYHRYGLLVPNIVFIVYCFLIECLPD